MKTGQIVSAPSITEFCNKVHMSGGWTGSISQVLDGKITQFRNWFSPDLHPLEWMGNWSAAPINKNRARKGKDRRCHLVHLRTGREINVRSITAFCQKARLKGNAHLHISPILDGKRLQYRGWVDPKRVNEKVSLTDVYGNQYKPVKVLDLIKQHGLKAGGLKRILSGKLLGTRRLSLAANPVEGELKPRDWRVTEYVFRERDLKRGGTPRVFRGPVLKDLAAQIGVDSSNLYPLLYGWRKRMKTGPYRHIEVVEVKTEKKIAVPELEVIGHE